jgi:hypothetical protein
VSKTCTCDVRGRSRVLGRLLISPTPVGCEDGRRAGGASCRMGCRNRRQAATSRSKKLPPPAERVGAGRGPRPPYSRQRR